MASTQPAYGERLIALLLLVVVEALSKPGFILTAPNRLVPGKDTTICVALSEAISTVDVRYALRSMDSAKEGGAYAESHATFSSHAGGCVALALPKSVQESVVLLAVQGNASDGYSFAREKQLGVLSAGNELTLIQTDKPVYKPGQTVKMRLATLTADLMPVLSQLHHVWIEDPTGVRVEQWLNVSTAAGIAELSYKLATEPPLGAWAITCASGDRRERVTFRVDEYVLPRFEVTIKSLPYAIPDTKSITGEICARYTYGQPVQGQIEAVFILLDTHGEALHEWSGYRGEFPYVLRTKVNGCTAYAVSTVDLGIGGQRGYFHIGYRLVIKASVEELGTGVRINASDVTVPLEPHDLSIDIICDDKYKPGLESKGKVKVSRRDGSPLPDHIVEVVVRDELTRTVSVNQTLTNGSGLVAFEIPQSRDVIHEYTVEARLLNEKHMHDHRYPRKSKKLKPWFSPSGSYLRLLTASGSGSVRCGKSAQVDLEYTTNTSQTVLLRIQVVGTSDIELSTTQKLELKPQEHISWNMPTEFFTRERSIDDETARSNVRQMYRGKKTLTFQVTSRMSPSARLLVFYIRQDGEVVADATTFEVEECTPNEVSMSFSKNTVRPGEEVSLRLSAAAGSLCAFDAVDRSVYIMDSSKRLSLKQLHSRLQIYRLSHTTNVRDLPGDNEHCEQQLLNGEETKRMPRLGLRGHSLYNDASHAFRAGATVVLTDLKLSTRPCTWYRPRMYTEHRIELFLSPVGPRGKSAYLPESVREIPRQSIVYKPSVEIRTYFPETWLWDREWINQDGKADKKLIVPHTITEWQGSAMCVHNTHGFGISGIATVKVFQPFFVSVELPYSVVRDESVPVTVSIYNYLDACLAIELIVKTSRGFVVKGSRNVTLCVCSKDSASHVYRIIPTTIGNVNVTVTSRSMTGGKAKVCPPGSAMSDIVGVRDSVVKEMLVEPEGAAREYTLSSYVCLRPEEKKATEFFTLLLPNDTVTDSARAYVSVIGDVMGPSLANLDSLLRMPWGCGEQNMLGFAPNIFIMQYLEATQQASDVIRAKAVEYMKSGYQRQLTYSHADNSYSAFGKQDASGSIWLTAFVVKCFAQARLYIHIDSKNLEASITYFGRQQLNGGCFPEVGKILHKDMKGGMGEESADQEPLTLTAYIVIALLEAGIPAQDQVVERAMACLDRKTVTDSYSLALLAYAYSLYDVTSVRRMKVIEQLMQKAIVKDGTTHWQRDATATPMASSPLRSRNPRPAAADVEMTAYAMLALLRQSNSVSAVRPIVRWLTQQRNAYGGFASTQDTILAIQALAKFASATYAAGSHMSIQAETVAFNRTFVTDRENSLILQSAQLPLLPVKTLAFTFAGQGCALVQANVRYNVRFYGASRPAFNTTVMTYRSAASAQKGCKQQTLAICTQYKGRDGVSNMAIVDVKMVSGWQPDKDSLRPLQSNKLVELKRYEIKDKTLSLYFDQISKRPKCFHFDVVQEQLVNEAKPGSVTTYDYYDPDLRHETSYSLNSCATKVGPATQAADKEPPN